MRTNMVVNQAELPEPLECPKCEQRSLIQQSINRYHCLSCRFHRDISQPDADGVLFFLLFVFLSVILAGYVVFAEEGYSPKPSEQFGSQASQTNESRTSPLSQPSHSLTLGRD